MLRPNLRLSRNQLHRPIVPALQLPDDVQGPIDFMLVIGTQASVYPAAGYIHVARL